MRPRRAPLELVSSLHPPEEAVLKREPETLIWRERLDGQPPVVVKMYRRRGRFTTLRSRMTRYRVEREFLRLDHLHRSGVPCTVPIGWAAGWDREQGHYEILVTREVPGGIELGDLLEKHGTAPDLAPLFRAVGAMHASGICHQALYLRNVLVEPQSGGEPRFVLLDMARSRPFPGSIVGSRMANYDLLDLTFELSGFDVHPSRETLAAYGPIDGFLRLEAAWNRSEASPLAKRTRVFRDGVVRVRSNLSWVRWRARRFLPGSR